MCVCVCIPWRWNVGGRVWLVRERRRRGGAIGTKVLANKLYPPPDPHAATTLLLLTPPQHHTTHHSRLYPLGVTWLQWAYEMFGFEREVEFVVMATPEDLRANAEYIRMADEVHHFFNLA